MDQGPVSHAPGSAAGARSWSWQLGPERRGGVQGLVVSPFGHLPEAQALFLRLTRRGGAWLEALGGVAPITPAEKSEKSQPYSTAIAFTWTGLAKVGLAGRMNGYAERSFSLPFREGMHQADRRRRLGDRAKGTVVRGGPCWGGDLRDVEAAARDLEGEAAPGSGACAAGEKAEVHALLLLYAKDKDALAARAKEVRKALCGHGVEVVRDLPLSLRSVPGTPGPAREHFGFADGFSQPIPYGDAVVASDGATPMPAHPWHGVKAGEILIGQVNAHGEAAPGPVVGEDADPGGLLPQGNAPEGFRDLGLDGTYMVVRELRQEVEDFWRSLHAAAEKIGDKDITAEWLAERIVGRQRDGDLLVPNGARPAVPDGERPDHPQPDNDFGFVEADPHGLGCPIGSHIRRANPRDGLADGPESGPDLLRSSNNHRILRRARKFGPEIAEGLAENGGAEGQERGLLFICLNTDIARQFEFIQQTWLLNKAFAALDGETDPLLGPAGWFTIPNDPLRRRIKVESYVRMVGGEYFFLPSIRALKYLASLPAEART